MKCPVESPKLRCRIYLKGSSRNSTSARAYGEKQRLTIGAIVTRALAAFLSVREGMVSRAQRPAAFQVTLSSIC